MALPDWVLRLPWDAIHKACDKFDLDPLLVAAIIMTESTGNPCVTRFEPEYPWLQKRLDQITFAELAGTTVSTERIGEATSWGSMQVMGSTLRDVGFRGPFPEMCDANTGVEWGCKYLKMQSQRYGGDETDVIASYNAGSAVKRSSGMYQNQKYVDKVTGYLKTLRGF